MCEICGFAFVRTFIVNSLVTGLWSLIVNCGWLRYDVCSVTNSIFLKAVCGVLYRIRSHQAGRRLRKYCQIFIVVVNIIMKMYKFSLHIIVVGSMFKFKCWWKGW